MNQLGPLYSLPLKELPIVIVDLETTGLRPQIDAICEIGAVRFRGGLLEEQFTTLVNPQRTIDEEVVKIHKLTNEMLDHAPLLDEVLPDFLSFIDSSVIAGHNAGFDISFLAPAALNWGLDLYRSSILDTAYLSRKL
ncbi:MAG TPA: endonuclease, partial [Myxococcales bacterium]|nr:endonuclease [Myxococcales bacterium]